jgi:hypothetical protein
MNQSELPPHAQLMQFILGKWISKPIYVAAELGIADLLAEEPKSIDDLAHATNTHAASLYRVLRALACVGIFTEVQERQFGLTPMAECLQTNALRSIARMFHADWHDRVWDHLLNSVRTGKTAFEEVHGMPAFDWFKTNAEATEIYQQANAVKVRNSHRTIIDNYDFSGIKKLTDVGGGLGALLALILESNSEMQGIVADLPEVIRETAKQDHIKKLQSRCKPVACDFFNQVPAGSDAYLLSHILHDWDDEHCRRILRNCHRAMASDTKLLVVEALIPAGNSFSIAKLMDLEVFVMGGGRERTQAEFQQLFQSSGFELSRIIPTRESISIIEGIPS